MWCDANLLAATVGGGEGSRSRRRRRDFGHAAAGEEPTVQYAPDRKTCCLAFALGLRGIEPLCFLDDEMMTCWVVTASDLRAYKEV
jgi:hypothetical protein